jgi:outer membrane protein
VFVRVATILGVLAMAGSVFAQTNAVRSLSLREAVDLALQHNFDVQVERYGPQIARFNLEQAYSAYVPVFETTVVQTSNTREGSFNTITGGEVGSTTTEGTIIDAGLVGTLPSGLTYDLAPNISHRSGSSIADDFYDGTAGISLRQPLLRNFFIDDTRRNILVGRKDIQISEYGLGLQINTTINDVEQAYFDLMFALENIKVQEASVALADRLAMENRRRVEVGTLAPLDERQAESELALRRADLVSAHQEYIVRQNQLKNLITDDYSKWHGIDIQPTEKLMAIRETFDIMESWRRGMLGRPDLQQLRLELERQDINVRYQRNQILPSFDLIGSYGHNGYTRGNALGVFRDQLNGEFPFYSFGAVLSVPLSNKGPRNAYLATKAQKEQALLRFKQGEQNVMVQIDNALKVAETTLERITATRKAREFAVSALQAEQKKMEAGRSTSFVVLQLQRDLTEARLSEIRALTDYNKALAQWAFNEGSSLQRHGLTISVK